MKDPKIKQKGFDKLSRIPIKVEAKPALKKPDWIRIKLSYDGKAQAVKDLLRKHKLHTVCEEASCPNLSECFSHGTATFMIMGDKCTRRCSFCDVGHGRPDPLDLEEPENLAKAVEIMQLKYVVITSVDRDDLRDGGAGHFSNCVNAIRAKMPQTKIETLVPDYRGRMEKALDATSLGLPDVFNHNIETAPQLYKQARPGSDYQWSLDLLANFKKRFPGISTKSGLMVGLGESNDDVIAVLKDLKNHGVDMITIGQYLQPTPYHMPVDRYVTPAEFAEFKAVGETLGFQNIASGPLVRSSYHADLQAAGEVVS